MNTHEYQGKAALMSFGAPVSEGQPAPTFAWPARLGKTLIDVLKGRACL
jgi:succinyl-CoA synthetase beta subunit